jgi:hypothetical protein
MHICLCNFFSILLTRYFRFHFCLFFGFLQPALLLLFVIHEDKKIYSGGDLDGWGDANLVIME